MNENGDLQQPNPKLSKFAVVSLIIPCVSIIGAICFILTLYHNINYTVFWGPFVFLALFFSPINFILAILALIRISLSHSLLKGYTFAILGILMSLPAFYSGSKAVDDTRMEARVVICEFNMREIDNAIKLYSNNDRYPEAFKWCDSLIAENPDIERKFLCPYRSEANEPNQCSYAINPNAEPNSAGDVVLLFETKDGWNQFGGPELMSFDNHYRKGCNVLFNDGHTEFIAPKQKDKLNWGN